MNKFKFNFKSFVSGIFVGSILVFSISTFAASIIKSAFFNDKIKLIVNGKQLDTEIVSVIKESQTNGSNYVSARALGEALGASVEWVGESNTILISDQNVKTISITPSPTPTSIPTITPTPNQLLTSTPTTLTEKISNKNLYVLCLDIDGNYYSINKSTIHKVYENNTGDYYIHPEEATYLIMDYLYGYTIKPYATSTNARKGEIEKNTGVNLFSNPDDKFKSLIRIKREGFDYISLNSIFSTYGINATISFNEDLKVMVIKIN
jgi:hypothetical protein